MKQVLHFRFFGTRSLLRQALQWARQQRVLQRKARRRLQALLGACALPLYAAAQTSVPSLSTNAANPNANVPAVVYRSVFKETSLGVEKDSADWRKANDDVGQFLRGHVDILKWEEQQSDKAMKAPMTTPAMQPDAMPKPAAPQAADNMPATSNATKPIAAPAHKH
jgi:hypothetical protein